MSQISEQSVRLSNLRQLSKDYQNNYDRIFREDVKNLCEVKGWEFIEDNK